MVFDVILSLSLLCLLALCNLFDQYRVLVLILGIITILLIFIIAILNIVKIKNKNNYRISSIVAAFAVLIISTYKYRYFVDSTSNTIVILHLLAILISVLIGGYDYFLQKKKRDFQKRERIISFFVTSIMFIFLFFGVIRFVNYSFDTSSLVELNYVIDNQLDDGHGGVNPNVVYVEYAVHPQKENIELSQKAPSISSIEVPESYELHKGDTVKIYYRQGLWEGIYYTEYN